MPVLLGWRNLQHLDGTCPAGFPMCLGLTRELRHSRHPPWHLQQYRAPSLWAESPSPHCPPNLSCPREAELSVPDLRDIGGGEARSPSGFHGVGGDQEERGGGRALVPAPSSPHPKSGLLLDLCNNFVMTHGIML